MIAPDPLTGTVYHSFGALSSSACYTPQKKVRGWSWQTYWLVQALVCGFALPIIGAVLTIPELGAVLTEAPAPAMRNSFLLGMAYGVGGTAFGSQSGTSASLSPTRSRWACRVFSERSSRRW